MDSWISEGLNSVLASGNPTGGLIEKMSILIFQDLFAKMI